MRGESLIPQYFGIRHTQAIPFRLWLVATARCGHGLDLRVLICELNLYRRLFLHSVTAAYLAALRTGADPRERVLLVNPELTNEHTRGVHILGSTPNPDETLVLYTIRPLTSAIDGVVE